MPVPLGSRGQAGFHQPIELLMDCHRRIENFLEILLKVADSAPPAPEALPGEHRRALETALHYFREAAPRHTQDEEESLFPRLRQCDSDMARAALERVAALEADHQRADLLHAQVDTLGRRWLEAGQLPEADRTTLRATLQQLRALYRTHIATEDQQVFPLAAQALPPDQLASIGQEMKNRRAPTPTPLQVKREP